LASLIPNCQHALVFRVAAFCSALPSSQWGSNAYSSATATLNEIDVKTPEEALERLMQGNQRYVTNKTLDPNQTSERRVSLSSEQHPFTRSHLINRFLKENRENLAVLQHCNDPTFDL
jgi:hypothetical protein